MTNNTLKNNGMRFLIILFYLLIPIICLGQSLKVTDVSLNPTDYTAKNNPVQDINGDTCALVIIGGEGLENLSFPNKNQYIQSSYKDGFHYVYMPTLSRRLECRHPDDIPLLIDLGEYGFRTLKGGKTYVVTIEADNIKKQGLVVLRLTPVEAVVTIDQKRIDLKTTDGILQIPLDKGIHQCEISASGYFPKKKTITVKGTETQSFTFDLEPITFPLNITTNVPKAKVYIDGNYFGTADQKIWISGGKHSLRLQAKGYNDREIDVTITDSNNNYDIQLVSGKTTKIITPQPVYVGWISGDVYVNKRKVDRRGDYIYLMPGKYIISDENYDQRKKITVEQSDERRTTPTYPTLAQAYSTSNQNITITVNDVSFTMVAVKGGTFSMGATSEQGSDAEGDENPAHRVTLSDYYIGQTEVTQALWQTVMGSNPSNWKGGNLPVEKVSWNDCQQFISKLNQLTGRKFRLPTEAEWEYAARGGGKSRGYKYAGSNDIGSVAWYYGNSSSKTHPVKQKQANELGLYDMSGNVWEWCQDWYDKEYYGKSPSSNPCNNTSASYRVYRGGGWCNFAGRCRVSNRNNDNTDFRNGHLGLRLAL